MQNRTPEGTNPRDGHSVQMRSGPMFIQPRLGNLDGLTASWCDVGTEQFGIDVER